VAPTARGDVPLSDVMHALKEAAVPALDEVAKVPADAVLP
jgi:hypothetical protein